MRRGCDGVGGPGLDEATVPEAAAVPDPVSWLYPCRQAGPKITRAPLNRRSSCRRCSCRRCHARAVYVIVWCMYYCSMIALCPAVYHDSNVLCLYSRDIYCGCSNRRYDYSNITAAAGRAAGLCRACGGCRQGRKQLFAKGYFCEVFRQVFHAFLQVVHNRRRPVDRCSGGGLQSEILHSLQGCGGCGGDRRGICLIHTLT